MPRAHAILMPLGNATDAPQMHIHSSKLHHFHTLFRSVAPTFGFLFPSAIKLLWPIILAFSARETISVQGVNVLLLEGYLYFEQFFLERKDKAASRALGSSARGTISSCGT